MYLGKMIEVTREAPENLGTAMKTIIARFEDMKKDPLAILEDGATANKVEAALATIGVALRDTAGEFRPLQDVFDELGAKWNTLTRNQQAYIATIAAGSRQQSRFLALMNNYDRTIELIAESQESAGAAAQQYAIYQDSVAAATARLQATWEEFYNKIVNSDLIITAIEGLTKLVEIMNKIGPIASAIGATVGALGLNLLGKSIIPQITKGLATVASSGQAATLSITGLIEGGGALLLTFGKVIGIAAAVAAAIYGIAKAVQWFDKHNNPDKYKVEELTKDIKDLNESISESSQKVKNLEDLMKRYDELNRKIYRTKEEQEELNDTINKINDVSKRAIVSIKENGDAHLYNADSVKQEIEAEKELAKYKADQRYKKVNELLEQAEKGNVSADQAREAGLQVLADSLEQSEDEEYKRYQQYRDNLTIDRTSYKNPEDEESKDRAQRYNLELSYLSERINDENFSKIFDDIEDFKYFLEKKGYTNLDYIKNKEDLYTLATNNNGILNSSNIFDRPQEINELIEEFYESSITDSTKQAINYLEDQTKQADDINKERNENLKNLAADYASTGDEAYKALFSLMEEGLIFTEDELNNLDWEKFYKNYSKDIQEYLESDRTQEDINKLLEAVQGAQGAILNGLTNYAEEVKKEISSNNIIDMQRRLQFLSDYAMLSSGDTRAAIISGNITENEEAKMKDIAKTQEFSQRDKDIFYKIFAENNTILDKYIDDYVKNLESGFYKKADQIKQLIINLLVQNGMTQEAAERTADFFVSDLNSALEKRLAKAEEDYKTAKEIYNKDSTEALTDKEYDFLQGQDINMDRYININEEGEKYLSILGKINLLENTRANYINQTNEIIKKNVDDIGRSRIEIAKANEELRTGKDLTGDNKKLTEDQIEARKSLIKTNEQLITNLKQENDLLAEQLQTQIDISNQAATMALTENISQAQKYANNIEKIGKALGEAQQNSMHIDWDTALGLLAMDDTYHQYIDTIDGMVTVNADGMKAMRDNEAKKYNDWLTEQKNQLETEKILLSQQLDTINLYLNAETEQDKAALKEQLENNQTKINEELKKKKEGGDKTEVQNQDMLDDLKLQYEEYYKQLFAADDIWKNKMTSLSTDISADYLSKLQSELSKELPTVTVKQQSIEIGDVDFTLEGDALDTALEEEKAQIEKRLKIIEVTLEQLDNLSINFDESFTKGIESAIKSSSGGEKALKDLEKAAKDLADALKDLDDLLIDIKRDFKDITIDYNPFMDLFEEWEHEWDYYYNIKNLLNQLETQSQYIDNVISADYSTAEEKLAAYDAKIGNITSKLAANDAYILTLRAGIAQQAKEFEEEFNEYYNVDNRMGGWQIFQRDTTLTQWNEVQNSIIKASYELSKLTNEQENELNLLEATQDALEQQRSAYESILSTVDSVIDSLENNENITVDLSELKGIKVDLEAAIKDESVEDIKEQIRNLNDYIQELNWQLDLNDNVVGKGIDDALEDMENGIEHIQELIDTLNDKIAEQQELVQELAEVYNYYVDTAISTQQEIYNAIVEGYQNEINKKKEQYNYLKQLDNDYLQSVKDNINKERQAREEANKQQDYQKNLQRAQLLQMDTSGAYRNELANLNKEIENQRQDLYDDLVDKQVDALEKEIEKRHELYDMEVAALEERLAYMQENAILLWEMVNDIVAEGSDAMMATLENTTDYINSNELAKEKQRKQWELSIQTTYKGVVDGEIENINARIAKGKEYVDSLEEIRAAIELSTDTYTQSQEILELENGDFQEVMDQYMQTWTTMTSDLTGYHEDWKTTVAAIKAAMEIDIQALEDLGNEGGAISKVRDRLEAAAEEMYNSFVDERNRYKSALDQTIDTLQTQIIAAINNAANSIQNAANNIKFNDVTPTGSSGGGTNGTSAYTSTTPGGGTNPESKKYNANVIGTLTDNVTGKSKTLEKDFSNLNSQAEIVRAANNWIDEEIQKFSNELADIYERPPYHNKRPNIQRGLTYNYYKQGGLADFTGPAWLDGTKSEPERVLSPKQTKLFESMVNSLERNSNNSSINSALGTSYSIGDINTSIQVAKMDDQTDINKIAKQVEDKIVKTIRNRVVVSV